MNQGMYLYGPYLLELMQATDGDQHQSGGRRRAARRRVADGPVRAGPGRRRLAPGWGLRPLRGRLAGVAGVEPGGEPCC
jgi:hypothetical protein